MAVVYERLYPLFQQAYEDLGYPGKYFNDRLVEVIDHLLQTPEAQTAAASGAAQGILRVRRPGPGGPFRGPEAADAHGPAPTSAIIKDKLRAFRAEIVKNK